MRFAPDVEQELSYMTERAERWERAWRELRVRIGLYMDVVGGESPPDAGGVRACEVILGYMDELQRGE